MFGSEFICSGRVPQGMMLGTLGLLLCAACGQEPSLPPLSLGPGEYGSSRQCGQCHRDIYAGWASSLHATAGLNALFRQAYEQARQTDPRAETLCLSCHTPAHIYGATNITAEESVAEGIGCDFCHSLRGLDPARRVLPYDLDLGPVKRGTIRDADSMAHEVAYSDLHVNSVMCAGCHEYATADGVPILTTYSEWQASPQAGEGLNCQDCHMPYVLADVVDPKVKRVGGVAVNLHQMPGGHSRQMLVQALRTGIASIQRAEGRLRVQVRVSNVGAGHSVPTGMPTRKVLLSVLVTSERGWQRSQQKAYERTMTDASGEELVRDSDVFLLSAGVAADNRLAPGETRLETFDFEDSPGDNLRVQVQLTYYYSPHNRAETAIRFGFFHEEKHLIAQFTRRP